MDNEHNDGAHPIRIDMRPAIMEFFEYEHLPEHLQKVSRPFCELAEELVVNLPWETERDVALRKLLESKDAAVRSAVAAHKMFQAKFAAQK
jgi:hypothetical protein